MKQGVTVKFASSNRELVQIFRQMASCYRYLGPKERFRSIAYEAAARTLTELKDDVSLHATTLKSLEELHGIGESIGKKIQEYLRSGKVRTFEQLKRKVPCGLLPLMDINGLGPATVKVLHQKLKVNNEADLRATLRSGKLIGIKGFGPKKVESIIRGLKLYEEGRARMLLPEAWKTGNELLELLRTIKQIKKADIAGSLRRCKETIGDIDIIACVPMRDRTAVIRLVLALPLVETVIAKGTTKISFLATKARIQTDIRLVDEQQYGSALQYFTGSKEHNVQLRELAKRKGWKLNEYGLFEVATKRRINAVSEEEIYQLLGLAYIPPELREEKGEIELAKANRLPPLLRPDNIRGDLQMHSTWSDGTESIEAIANYVLKAFPSYEYIVLTDHSQSERVAHGLQPAGFRRQFREIDRINMHLGRQFVKKGVEVDILADGSLDLPNDVLCQMDWVVASIHSGFTRDNTERLLRACLNPYVHCIGHPSGRLLGKRDAYPVDWDKLFHRMVETATAIEVNGQAERLDLRDDLIRQAVRAGVKLVISSDAHSLPQLHYMRWGVAMARRGWATRKDVLNSKGWASLEAFKQLKAKKCGMIAGTQQRQVLAV